jgi:hypothetical protein
MIQGKTPALISDVSKACAFSCIHKDIWLYRKPWLLFKKIPYFLLVCLIAAGLISTLDATASGPAEFMLGWDANKEADLDGYEIYFRKGVPGATYNFLAEVYVDELEDPDNPVVTITDVNNGFLIDIITPVVRMAELANNSTYHFALTAFDTQGKISDFSEELCVEVIGTSVVECRSADGGSDGDDSADNAPDSGSDGSNSDGSAENGTGGGSGGGCFIAASSFVFRETVAPLFY